MELVTYWHKAHVEQADLLLLFISNALVLHNGNKQLLTACLGLCYHDLLVLTHHLDKHNDRTSWQCAEITVSLALDDSKRMQRCLTLQSMPCLDNLLAVHLQYDVTRCDCTRILLQSLVCRRSRPAWLRLALLSPAASADLL